MITCLLRLWMSGESHISHVPRGEVDGWCWNHQVSIQGAYNKGHCDPIINGSGANERDTHCLSDPMQGHVRSWGGCQDRDNPRLEMSRNRRKQHEQEPELYISSPHLWRTAGADCSFRPGGPWISGLCPSPSQDVASYASPANQVPSWQDKWGKEHAPEMTAITTKGIVENLMTLLSHELASFKGLPLSCCNEWGGHWVRTGERQRGTEM